MSGAFGKFGNIGCERIVMLTKLFNAVFEIEKNRIAKKNMVILCPIGFFSSLLLENAFHEAHRDVMSNNPMFSGILVVEDESMDKVIVRSLISEHRVEVEI